MADKTADKPSEQQLQGELGRDRFSVYRALCTSPKGKLDRFNRIDKIDGLRPTAGMML